ncbi:hypothetical protein N8D56_03090 [Devosia sp. A8/3-2]|nr:hypothetical protein N8D56_03090 [Devosia sp. A8/3-2]
MIDMESDARVKDTPVRIRVDDETISLAEVRQRAQRRARPVLDRSGIDGAVEVLALNGDARWAPIRASSASACPAMAGTNCAAIIC